MEIHITYVLCVPVFHPNEFLQVALIQCSDTFTPLETGIILGMGSAYNDVSHESILHVQNKASRKYLPLVKMKPSE